MRYERKYIQYNDLVFDGYGMLGEYDASSVSFKVTTHARSFGHGSYAPFKSPNAFVEESSVSLTLWLKEKKLPCDVRPFYRSFVIEQLSKHGKLWAVQDNTLVWAYATVQSYSEMVEHANGKLGIDVDFLLYEGVWHKADKQKTFLHPYDLCTFMDCFDYKEYQPCVEYESTPCCEGADIPAQTLRDRNAPYSINLTCSDVRDKYKEISFTFIPRVNEGTWSPTGTWQEIAYDEFHLYLQFSGGESQKLYSYDLPPIYSGELNLLTGEAIQDAVVYDATSLNWEHIAPTGWRCNDLIDIIECPPTDSDVSRIRSTNYEPAATYPMSGSADRIIGVTASGSIIVRNGSDAETPTGDILVPLKTSIVSQVHSPISLDTYVGTTTLKGYPMYEESYQPNGEFKVETTGYHRDASNDCSKPIPKPENERYCCECDCDQLTQDMALCYHLDDLQDVYKECSNAGFRVIYDCKAAERFFNILGQRICTDNCSNGTLAGRIYSETDLPTTGVTITLVGKMHNPYVEINGNGNWIAGDYDGRLSIRSNGEVYYENGCKCDDPLEPDVWQIPQGMNYGWTVLPRYNRVVVNLGACCGKACAYFNIDNLTI